MQQRIYPAKILLLGEYTVLNGSGALAAPIRNFFGRWEYSDYIDQRLVSLAVYFEDKLSNILDINAFEKDVQKGLTFVSDIPMGYGCGSSGALIAAIYDQYKTQSFGDDHLVGILGSMESYYHGSSSGFDPLISYKQVPILKEDATTFDVIEDVNLPELYLFDSGEARSTDILVKAYKSRVQSDVSILPFLKVVDEGIETIVEYPNQFEEVFHTISDYQQMLFDFAIHPHVAAFWQEGLESGQWSTKLCGSGGGGFYLVMKHGDIPAKYDSQLTKIKWANNTNN